MSLTLRAEHGLLFFFILYFLIRGRVCLYFNSRVLWGKIILALEYGRCQDLFYQISELGLTSCVWSCVYNGFESGVWIPRNLESPKYRFRSFLLLCRSVFYFHDIVVLRKRILTKEWCGLFFFLEVICIPFSLSVVCFKMFGVPGSVSWSPSAVICVPTAVFLSWTQSRCCWAPPSNYPLVLIGWTRSQEGTVHRYYLWNAFSLSFWES